MSLAVSGKVDNRTVDLPLREEEPTDTVAVGGFYPVVDRAIINHGSFLQVAGDEEDSFDATALLVAPKRRRLLWFQIDILSAKRSKGCPLAFHLIIPMRLELVRGFN